MPLKTKLAWCLVYTKNWKKDEGNRKIGMAAYLVVSKHPVFQISLPGLACH